MRIAESSGWVRQDDFGQIELRDLFGNGAEVMDRLLEAAAKSFWLDAFLLAAGAQQLIDDHGRRFEAFAARCSNYLRHRASIPSRILRRSFRASARFAAHRYDSSSCGRRAAALSDELGRLLDELAPTVFGRDLRFPTAARICRRTEFVSMTYRSIAREFTSDVVRLPACFHSFDQHPRDIQQLARKFADAFPERDIPIVVVGVRTSGTYLAPICAYSLRQLGFSNVTSLSIRPGKPSRDPQRNQILHARTGKGLFVVVDDPPVTGSSVIAAVDDLCSIAGITPDRVVAMLATASGGIRFPKHLSAVHTVVLPYDEWSINQRLQTDSVRYELNALAAPSRVVSIKRIGAITRRPRGHASARYRVVWGGPFADSLPTDVMAEGTGLGYFGRHVEAVADGAPWLFPEVIGTSDGVCYRRHPSAEFRLSAGRDKDAVAQLIVDHLAQRHERFAMATDRSALLAGREPAWEIAARIFGRLLGPVEMVTRAPVTEPIMRATLRSESPTLVDGHVDERNWFKEPGKASLTKVEFARAPFGHLDRASYDAAFDLAGVAVRWRDESIGRLVRLGYEARRGAPVSAEKWLLLRAVHVWDQQRAAQLDEARARRLLARFAQEYFAERYLSDLESACDGPFCVLDLDGVLETSPLGFPATTQRGALALRALRAHGLRVALASGRSLSEIEERCIRYGLVGGIAEYGAVVYNGNTGEVLEMLSDPAREAVAELRSLVSAQGGIVVDDDYSRIVRAYRLSQGGQRVGLDDAQSVALLKASRTGDLFRRVQGEEQTDFVPREADKGLGVIRLVEQLSGRSVAEEEHPVDFAVGDSAEDLSFLRLAERPCAPANCAPELRAGPIGVARAQYQSGLSTAVRNLIGHRPGDCEVCRSQDATKGADLIPQLLSLREAGMRGLVPRWVRLVRAARKAVTGSK